MSIVISTQMPEQFKRLKHLSDNKIELINVPMIKLEQIEINQKLEKQINSANTFDWILFTSMRAVEFFFNIYEKNTESLKLVKFACIGSSTQKKLAEYNIKTNYINEGNTSADFSKYLICNNIIHHTDKVMHPTGNKASSILADQLGDYCKFETIVIYNTIGIKEINKQYLEIIKSKNYELILFTSPSAFINFVEISKNSINHNDLKIAAIGDVTNNAINELGYKSKLVSSKPDLETLLHEILKYLKIVQN